MRTVIWIRGIALGLTTTAAIVLGVQLAAADSASSGAGPLLTHKQVLHIALVEAKDSQDLHPKRIEMATGTFASAEQLLESKSTMGSLKDGEEVDAVVLHGSFHINAPHPRGHPIAPGKVLGLILDAHTGSVEVRTLGDVAPALSHLGRVTRLR